MSASIKRVKVTAVIDEDNSCTYLTISSVQQVSGYANCVKKIGSSQKVERGDS